MKNFLYFFSDSDSACFIDCRGMSDEEIWELVLKLSDVSDGKNSRFRCFHSFLPMWKDNFFNGKASLCGIYIHGTCFQIFRNTRSNMYHFSDEIIIFAQYGTYKQQDLYHLKKVVEKILGSS